MVSKVILNAFATPNGLKITCYLRALGVPFHFNRVDITKGEQKQPWFLRLNPDGKIPNIVDNNTGIVLNQTGAILLYLADSYDTHRTWSYPPGTPNYYKMLEVLTLSISQQAPMQGQANHFVTQQPSDKYAVKRFIDETTRVYKVLDEYLKRNREIGPYFAGSHYSCADFSVYPWANDLGSLGIQLKKFPHIDEWFSEMSKLESVKQGMNDEGTPLVIEKDN